MPTLRKINYPITRVWQNAAGQLVLKFKFRVAALRQARKRYMPPFDHSESFAVTYNFSSSTFDNGQRKPTIFVDSLKADFLPAFLRLPPDFFFDFFILTE